MDIRKISGINIGDTVALEQAFASITPQKIACCNWPEEFAYAPIVSFRIFHTGDRLMLRFEVEEQCTAARVTIDNGEVWTDSCVEFFLALDDKGYYNFETTCIGRMLLGYHRSRSDAEHATAEVLATIIRTPSLGTEPFAEQLGDNRWSLTLAIPAQALFNHTLSTWDGVEARANFYKCGDKLSQPHFLSWRPITTPAPNFHCPEFFEKIKFSNI